MSAFALLLARDTHDLVRSTAFRLLTGALLVLAAVLAAGAGLLLAPSPAAVSSTPDRPNVSLLIGTMLYFVSLLPLLVLVWVFAGTILTQEKASGHLETLLATPLSTRTLWLAKTAAIALPGLALAGVSSALIVSAVTLATRLRPGAAAFTLPSALLVVCWVGNPLLFAGLGAVTTLLALRSSPDAAIVPSFALGFGLMAGVPAGMALGLLDLASWPFAAGYLGGALVEWIVVLALARGLTKERIVLSSRDA